MDRLQLGTADPPKPKCKGAVYRGKTNVFINKRKSIVVKDTLVFMASLSCKGCEDCGGLSDMLAEYVAEDALLIPVIEEGKLYTLHVSATRDWESGMVDDVDVSVVELNRTKV